MAESGRVPKRVIRLEVPDAGRLRKASCRSPVKRIDGISWDLGLSPYQGKLAAYVYFSDSNDSQMWSVDALLRITLFNVDKKKNVVKSFNKLTYTRDAQSWGGDLLAFDQLLKEDQGFIANDAVTVEAEVVITDARGFRLSQFVDFTDGSRPEFDVTLLIEGCKIHAGKQILASHSPVFYSMFYSSFKEKNEKEIELKVVKKEEFLDLLRYIYSLERKITAEQVEPLLALADRFQIKFLLDICEDFLKEESTLSMLEKFKLSDQYRLAKLQGHCINSFKKIDDITALEKSESYKALSDAAKLDLLHKVMRIANP